MACHALRYLDATREAPSGVLSGPSEGDRRRQATTTPAELRSVVVSGFSDPGQEARPALASRLGREVKARWQPQIRAKAKQRVASTGGIIIVIRARLGYAAPIGSTDQDRICHLTVARPPVHAARLFDAQDRRRRPQRSTSRTVAAAPAPWTKPASPTSNTSSSTCRPGPEKRGRSRVRCD